MEAKYTKGPWKCILTYETFVSEDSYPYDWEVRGADGELVCKLRGKNRAANARLIEISPKLLQMCKIAEEICSAQLDPEHCAHNNTNWQSLRNDFRAAFLSATSQERADQ